MSSTFDDYLVPKPKKRQVSKRLEELENKVKDLENKLYLVEWVAMSNPYLPAVLKQKLEDYEKSLTKGLESVF